jgi:hypothetical protein
MGWGKRHVRAVLRKGKRVGTHFTGGWVGSKVGLDGCQKFRSSLGFDPRTVQPVEHCRLCVIIETTSKKI